MRFELIKGTKTLQGTCYFEFVKNSDRRKPCWNENAYYLEDGVFAYFANVFSNTSDSFDYYSFCKFNQSELNVLGKNLIDFSVKLSSTEGLEEFGKLVENKFCQVSISNEFQDNWKTQTKSLQQISYELKELADECLENKEIFWVLGL